MIQRQEQGDPQPHRGRCRPSPRHRRERRRWQQRRLGDHTLTVELPVDNQACETAGPGEQALDMHSVMETLARSRPVFYSESDFKHALS